jgi:hypothetical protein
MALEMVDVSPSPELPLSKSQRDSGSRLVLAVIYLES